jgi:uncharacterized protein involved in exopolysaccharide biosynthesis
MMTHASNLSSRETLPQDLDEIDLRRYLQLLVQWRREIILIPLLAAGLAIGAVTFLNSQRPILYTASADVVIARFTSNINIDERFDTNVNAVPVDNSTWRNSLVALVYNEMIAASVIEELGDGLPDDLKQPSVLQGLVSAEVPTNEDGRETNLVRINARTLDPALSALIADSWTRHYIDYINSVYGQVPASTIADVSTEHDAAFEAYEMAQTALEEFIANNQIDALEREIFEKSNLRSNLVANYNRVLSETVSSNFDAQLKVYNSLSSFAANSAFNALDTRLAQGRLELESLYEMRSKASLYLNQARAMERVLVAGGEAAAKSNVQALQLFKMLAFGSGETGEPGAPLSTVPVLSNSATVDMSVEEQITDVRAIVATLEEDVATLDAQVEELSARQVAPTSLGSIDGLTELSSGLPISLTNPAYSEMLTSLYNDLLLPNAIIKQLPIQDSVTVDDASKALFAQLDSDLGRLSAALSAEMSRELQLTRQQELAWTTYETLGSKLQELNLLRATTNSEVRLGSSADFPVSPDSKMGFLLPAVVAAFAAFLFALILALAVDALGGSPFLTRRAV